MSTRIGLYGGSFNPIHLGHLRAAIEVADRPDVEEVWLIPANHPPHKNSAQIAPASDRVRMLEEALGEVGELRIERIELEREGPSYSIDTVRSLKKKHPGTEFALILGFDAFSELDSWHAYPAIVEECDLIVVARPPHRLHSGENKALFDQLPIAVSREFCYDEAIGCYVHASGRRLELLPVTQLDISASELRDRVARGESIRFLVPEKVRRYIVERGLYR